MQPQTLCTAFDGSRRIASGELGQVAIKAKEVIDRNDHATVLIFDDGTSHQIEVDFRGTPQDVLRRLAAPSPDTPAAPEPAAPPRGPGRPKLGVVAREVTLLPRHWEWLSRQPGGASVALRKLVEGARHSHVDRDRMRAAQEAAYRFMSAIAGNAPGFEEATRALFANDRQRFEGLVTAWPTDVRDHARKLAGLAFDADNASMTGEDPDSA